MKMKRKSTTRFTALFLALLMTVSSIFTGTVTVKASEPTERVELTDEQLEELFDNYAENYDKDGNPALAVLSYLSMKVVDKVASTKNW